MKTTIYDFNELGRTHKSIGVNEVITNAVRNNVDTISVISSGNYVRSLIGEIRNRGLEGKLRIVNLSNERLGLPCEELLIEPKRILRDSAEREQFVTEQLGEGVGKVWDSTDYIPDSYLLKAGEILEARPDYVSLGVGSGKLFLALSRTIKQKGLATKLIGFLPKAENGVFNENNIYEENGKLYFKSFDPQSPADKLVCPYTYHKPEILQSCEDGHVLIEVDDKDFKVANRKARKLGLESEVSGSAGFVFLDPEIREKYGLTENSNVVLINTGRGYNWENQLRRERRRKGLFAGLAATVAAAGLVIGGLFYNSIPSAEEMKYADLNGDGVVSAEEIYQCHLIAGTFDWNTEYEKYEKLKEHPWIDRKTLAEMKYQREILEKEVIARYKGNILHMHKVLGENVKFEYLSDLSFNQLHYLDERAQFEDLSNPEFYRARLDRARKNHDKGIDIPIWDVM